MVQNSLDFLKARYDYASWEGAQTLEENLFIWRYFLTGGELPGWRLEKVRAQRWPEWPAIHQSTWLPSLALAPTALRLDVHECASRRAAQEFLLRLLAESQAPFMERRADGAGDVAFHFPGHTGIVFSRGNLVTLLTHAERAPTPLAEVATGFDAHLVSKPEAAAEAPPELAGLAGVADVAAEIPFDAELKLRLEAPADTLEAAVGEERPRCYKLFSPSGEVSEEAGELIYRPAVRGRQRLEVYALDAEERAAVRRLELGRVAGS